MAKSQIALLKISFMSSLMTNHNPEIWRQVSPFFMLLMARGETIYSLDMLYAVRLSLRILRTSFSVSLAVCVFAPFGCLSRAFSIMSAILSSGVPRNKWSGFTHAGVSHEWQTNSPLGTCPT